jgi:glycosyltransferase involved in cell wall biosynthesis
MSNKILILKKVKKKPAFSIITVVKNSDNLILNTIRSIEKQSFRNFEFIIIDGGSTDYTVTKILSKKKNISYLISQKDKGIYDAMNKGIKISNGKIIVFVNSGDILMKNALKIIWKIFLKKKIDFVFGTVKRNYTKKTILKYGYNPKRLRYNFDFATTHSVGFFMKKSSIDKVGLYDIRYKCSADYDYYYRTIIKNKMTGSSTKKSQLIGILAAGGYSSKISFINHLFEECKIRFNNKQNIFIIMLIFLNATVKHLLKKFV